MAVNWLTRLRIWRSLAKIATMRRFSVNDRIRISEDFFWPRGALGTITEPPGQVTAISGPWEGNLTRQEVSALGENTVYWVWFDEPQIDADGDGPYRGGMIWEDAMILMNCQTRND
jgi:hypothetical protein